MPPANSINESTTGIVGFTGTAFTATPATNHAVMIGGSTSSTLTNVGPTATAGQVLQSAGAAADPAFSTATYPLTTTVNQILYSSATNTVTGLANGTTGQVLTATTGSAPSWAANGVGDVVGPASSTDNALVRFDGTTGKLIQNGVITEDDTGNLSITASVSGATLSTTLSNTSNTASSNALEQITVAGTSAGDAFTTYTVAGTTNWSQGIDNSVTGDPYVLAASTALGTTNVMSVTTAGEMTRPLQPAFQAYLNATATDVTGDATTYTVLFGNEIFDQGSDFDTSTGTFTAPVTGIYAFNTYLDISGILVGHVGAQIYIATTAQNFFGVNVNPATTRELSSGNSTLSLGFSIICSMTAGNTATVKVVVSGSTKTIDIIGAGNGFSTFSGYLVC